MLLADWTVLQGGTVRRLAAGVARATGVVLISELIMALGSPQNGKYGF